jgi:hypothetical protein
VLSENKRRAHGLFASARRHCEEIFNKRFPIFDKGNVPRNSAKNSGKPFWAWVLGLQSNPLCNTFQSRNAAHTYNNDAATAKEAS